MNFLRISPAPSRAQPNALSSSMETFLASISSALTYLNRVRAVNLVLYPNKNKYDASVLATYSIFSNISGYYSGGNSTTSGTGGLGTISTGAGIFVGSYLAGSRIYGVTRLNPPTSGFQKYICGFWEQNSPSSNNTIINSVNTSANAPFTYILRPAAPCTTFNILPNIPTNHTIITSPTSTNSTLQKYGFMAATESTDHLYIFGRTRWSRVLLSSY